MAEITVDITYGQALFDAAGEVNKIDIILEEGKELISLFEKEKDFFSLICSPVISAAEKKKIVETVLSGKISKELVNFLYVLIDKGRAKHFDKIIKRYQNLIDAKHGFSIGTIFSVNPLSSEQLSAFEEKTSKLLQKSVKLENKTDSTILGGVRIFIEGKIIDATVKKRLNDLRESLI